MIFKRYETVSSTQEVAWEVSRTSSPDEVIVVQAQRQLSGRGRYGRRWMSPSGGLWLTISLSEELLTLLMESLPLAIGLITAETLDNLLNLKLLKLAFPNDLILTSAGKLRKVGGILIERRSHGENSRFLIGIGINVKVSEGDMEQVRLLNPNAISLSEVVDVKLDLSELSELLVKEVISRLGDSAFGDLSQLVKLFSKRDALKDREVRIITGSFEVSGTYRGLIVKGEHLYLTLEAGLPSSKDKLSREKLEIPGVDVKRVIYN